jgi:hypothetical protein
MATCARPTPRSNTRAEDLVWAAVRALGRIAFALLVAFHAWLLWTEIGAGTLFEPQVALRWLVSGGVLVGFRSLNRLGLPLFFGRRAVVLWLLVILIHCHAAWTGGAAGLDLGVPETVGALAQITGSLGVLGALAIVLLAACAGDAQVRRPVFIRTGAVAGLPSDGFTFCFAPRPPPLS